MVLIGLSLFQNLAWEGNEPFLGVQFSALLALWVLRSVENEVLCFSFPPHSTALCREHMQMHYRISCSAGKKNFLSVIKEDDVSSSLFHSSLQITGKFLANSRTECLFSLMLFLLWGKHWGFFSFSSRNL
uniref:Uncharacterized protein n=1 Tax=Micrurus surinamensis TaxID=129470 RepID=A0A2D4NX68_MICSU